MSGDGAPSGRADARCDACCDAEARLPTVTPESDSCDYGRHLTQIFGDHAPSYHDLAHLYLTLRETNARLNRRCQSAESGLAAKLTSGPSLGRALANSAATLYRAQLDEARAEIARLRSELLTREDRDLRRAVAVEQAEYRVARMAAVVEAAREWKRAHEWAEQNPEKLVKSIMTFDEAAETIREYFSKRDALLAALSELDRAAGAPPAGKE